MLIKVVCAAGAVLAAAMAAARADDLYVSPTGKDGARGTREEPLSLMGACRRAVAPGTTVYLLDGTYKMKPGSPVPGVSWKGTKDKRIVLRSAPGEWAVIDGRLNVEKGAAYVTLRDFEITRTEDENANDPNWWKLPVKERPSYGGGANNLAFKMGGDSINLTDSESVHLINLYAHDNVSGGCFGVWNPARNTLIYGCIQMRNGWDDRGRGHGHGCYIQNGWPKEQYGDSIKEFRHCISAYHHSTGSKSYGQRPDIRGTHFDGNIYYCNGMLSWTNGTANYLAGSYDGVMDDIIVRNCVFYQPDKCTGDVGGTVYLGWGGKNKERCVFEDNYVFGGGASAVTAQFWKDMTFTGNTIYDDKKLVAATDHENRMKNWKWDRNTYYGGGLAKPMNGLSFDEWKKRTAFDAGSKWIPEKPKGTMTFLFPNEYDLDRAHVAVCNWDRKAEAEIDLSSFLKKGDGYVIYDAFYYRQKPVAEGTYAGGMTKVEMRPDPVGNEFHALVVQVTKPSEERRAAQATGGKRGE